MDLILLQSADSAGMINLVFIGAMVLVFYFFMIRPQQKRQKEQKSFQEELDKGTQVVTASGIIGKITKVEEETVTLEVSAKTYITVTKTAISKEMTDALFAKSEE